MNPISDNDDEYLLRLVDCEDEDLIFEDDFVENDYGLGKNYNMLRQLILDAGSNYIEEEGQTKLEYYLENLQRVDSLKFFIDDQYNGLLHGAYFLLVQDNTKTEAILRYIVDHKNVEFHEHNIASAARGSKYIFFRLIELGGNVHYKPSYGFTPLHFAVLGKRTDIVKYLLDQNVDVNCYSHHNLTPLHHAFATNNNFDVIELLIQYGADIHLPDSDSETPFEYGIMRKQFNNVASVLNSRLNENIITFDLLIKMFSCFCQLHSRDYEIFPNYFSHLRKPQGVIEYYDCFKLLWETLIKYFITNNNNGKLPILSIYLNNNLFYSREWANALTVLLTSEIASTLLDECVSYEKKSIFSLLIPKLVRAEVELEDRVNLLKLLLSSGMVPNLKDMALLLTHYRFNEEFQLLNLSLRDDCLLNSYNQENPMEYIASIFCGLENDLDYNMIFGEELPDDFYDYIKQYFTPALSNCSSNAYYRNRETSLPNILSLQELSRNSVRKFIGKNKILSPRDFISAVDSLPIPFKCKNYILLKTKVEEL